MKHFSSKIVRARRTHLEAAAAAGVIAFVVLLGWIFNLDSLKRIVPGPVAMNPITAAAFLLAAISIALFSGRIPGRQGSARLWFARACASIIGFVGAVKLIVAL